MLTANMNAGDAPPPSGAPSGLPDVSQLNLLDAAFLFGLTSNGKLRDGQEKYMRVAAVLQMVVMDKVHAQDSGNHAILHVHPAPNASGRDPVGTLSRRERQVQLLTVPAWRAWQWRSAESIHSPQCPMR